MATRSDSAKSLQILVDGYNLDLPSGTGVATYGRVLTRIYRDMGHSVNVLYGKNIRPSKNPLLNEIAFFDSKANPAAKGLKVLRTVSAAYSANLGCRIDHIPLTGTVVLDSISSRLPAFDRLSNSTELYLRCLRSFRWFGRFAQIRIPGLQIAHWTYPLPIRAKGALNVYTLHDLVPLRLPYTTLDNKRRYYKLCKRLVDSADHILTVSEASRKDIIDVLGADPSKVTNTYQSVSFPAELLDKSEQAIRDEISGIFGLTYKGYFLFFGAVEPKKNLGRLMEAYLASNVKTPLLIVGAPGWQSDEELKLLNNVKLLDASGSFGGRIKRLEYLPRAMLVSLIRGAKSVLFPSLYEGFGLPVLESMLLGTAVLTSNTSSLPEVAGDAALSVNPYDTRAMSEAIRVLDAQDDLRRDLEQRGPRQAALFDEARYRERLGAVFENLAVRRARSR